MKAKLQPQIPPPPGGGEVLNKDTKVKPATSCWWGGRGSEGTAILRPTLVPRVRCSGQAWGTSLPCP